MGSYISPRSGRFDTSADLDGGAALVIHGPVRLGDDRPRTHVRRGRETDRAACTSSICPTQPQPAPSPSPSPSPSRGTKPARTATCSCGGGRTAGAGRCGSTTATARIASDTSSWAHPRARARRNRHATRGRADRQWPAAVRRRVNSLGSSAPARSARHGPCPSDSRPRPSRGRRGPPMALRRATELLNYRKMTSRAHNRCSTAAIRRRHCTAASSPVPRRKGGNTGPPTSRRDQR